MSVLQAIVHDPFISWKDARPPQQAGRLGGGKAKRGRDPSQEEWAGLKALATIEGRLAGVLAGAQSQRTQQMTVQGHVDFLIREATDSKQLARMFFGWSPYF